MLSPSSLLHGAHVEDIKLVLGSVDVGLLRETASSFVPAKPDRQVTKLVDRGRATRGKQQSSCGRMTIDETSWRSVSSTKIRQQRRLPDSPQESVKSFGATKPVTTIPM